MSPNTIFLILQGSLMTATLLWVVLQIGKAE